MLVNVEPNPSALVGVRADGDESKGYGGKDAFVFPMRVGNQTSFLSAEVLPMYMDPKVRRAIILLSKIPPHERLSIVNLHMGQNCTGTVALDDDHNSVRVGGNVYPLDQIESVWMNAGTWFAICNYFP